jgi:hypothetical protein
MTLGPATQVLLDRARARMRGKELLPFVAFDPGACGYATVFAAIVEHGAGALTREHEGTPLYASFDFRETIGLTRWGTPRDPVRGGPRGQEDADGRWFRVLTCAAHLAARSLGEQEIVFHYTLVTLLADALALDADGAPDGPLELLFEVFAEARAGVLRGEGDPFERDADEAFALLAQLLVASDVEPAALDALNARLAELDAAAREYYLPGTYEPNPRFVRDDAFVWGLTTFDQLHTQWLALVVERFPRSSVALETTRAKLIDAGRARSSAKRKA